MTVINTNVAAQMTANAMKSNQRAMETTMERLATGSRGNSAKDDAAGLAIGQKMTSQIRGFEQAVRNANDGISMLQTADGAASQITDLLQRMRELAVQGQNDTNSTKDKDNLNQEFVALATEIDRIANTTTFNGESLLNTNNAITLTVGVDVGDVIDVSMGDFNLAAGTATSKGIDTITLAVADMTDLGTAAATINLTDSSGNTIIIAQADIASASAQSSFASATVSELATAINNAISDAGSGFSQMTAAATSTTTITLTQDTAGVGSISNISFTKAQAVVDNSATAGVVNTTRGGAGSSATPMGANLSSYASAGDHVEASGTLAALDAAIEGVNTARADFGANISRLGHTVDNLNVAAVNASAAKSAVMDADYCLAVKEAANRKHVQKSMLTKIL